MSDKNTEFTVNVRISMLHSDKKPLSIGLSIRLKKLH